MEKVHGETWCEHCNKYVVLCSHGMGIDYYKLYKWELEKTKLAIEVLEFCERDCKSKKREIVTQTLEKLR